MVRYNNEIRIALINPVGIKSGRIFLLRIEIYTHEHLEKILFDMKGCGMMRKEHDFLGEMEVPDEVYYGVQTVRAMENFHITGEEVDKEFIQAVVMVKKAAALANMDTGRMKPEIGNALVAAADEILSGALLDQFPVDPIQGGAGTSVNMNVNEVLTNRALELTGHKKGEYQFISPNNHANMAQSTNDVFPTAIKVCMRYKAKKLIEALKRLAVELDNAAKTALVALGFKFVTSVPAVTRPY
jgi:aspartate ammonia-lyase